MCGLATTKFAELTEIQYFKIAAVISVPQIIVRPWKVAQIFVWR